jgi:signal transduction histidine kinase
LHGEADGDQSREQRHDEHAQGGGRRLKQIFLNLLNNAVKYTMEGGRIWINATVEGSQAVVRISDTGPGIKPETLPRIFEMFTQEARASGLGGRGLGIGLAGQEPRARASRCRRGAQRRPRHG